MMATRTEKQDFKLIFNLGMLSALTPFFIDLYLPAFLKISQDIHAPLQSMPGSTRIDVYYYGIPNHHEGSNEKVRDEFYWSKLRKAFEK